MSRHIYLYAKSKVSASFDQMFEVGFENIKSIYMEYLVTISLLWCLIRLKKIVNRKLRWMW